jgi:hypothetical protein
MLEYCGGREKRGRIKTAESNKYGPTSFDWLISPTPAKNRTTDTRNSRVNTGRTA